MNQELYCIYHDDMVLAEGAGDGHEQLYADPETGIEEFYFCDFPDGYATCPPPEMEEDWMLVLLEDRLMEMYGVSFPDDDPDSDLLRGMTLDGIDNYGSL